MEWLMTLTNISKQLLLQMIANLDGDVDIALKNYRIPKMLAYYEKEINEYYV